MIIQPILLSLCAVIVLSGCSINKAAKTIKYNDNVVDIANSPSSLNKAQMQIYLTSAESQLLSLQQQNTKPCISGQLAIAQIYLDRATAEHNAGMENDAFITLVDLDRQVRKIHCVNKYINGQLGCGYTNKKVVLKRWYDEGDYYQCDNVTIVKAQKETGNKHVLITETLHDFNQAEIKPIYYQSLNKLVQLIKIYPNSTLLISGHTDTLGSSTYNIELGKKRAQNVVKYFTDKGIEASHIVMKTNGEKHIREVEQSDVSRVFNRYTSITLFLDTSEKDNI